MEEKEHSYTAGGTANLYSLWKTVRSFLRKLRIDLPYDPAIPLLGIYPQRLENPMFIAALFTVARIWKQPKCPMIDDWLKKRWYIYTMRYSHMLEQL